MRDEYSDHVASGYRRDARDAPGVQATGESGPIDKYSGLTGSDTPSFGLCRRKPDKRWNAWALPPVDLDGSFGIQKETAVFLAFRPTTYFRRWPWVAAISAT